MASRRPSAKRFTRFPHLHRHGVPNQKGIYIDRSFSHHISRFPSSIRHSLAPYLYTLNDFIPQYLLLDTAGSAHTQTHETRSRLALIHLLASNTNFFSFSCSYYHHTPREGEEVSGGIFRLLPVVQRDQSGHCRVGGDKKRRGHIFSFCFFLSVILHTNVVLFSFCINIIIKNTYNINCVDYEPCFLLTSNSDHVSPLLNACRVSVSC